MKISLILAAAQNGAIGKNNRLLWHLPADMKFFRQITTGHHILTGRKNYESIPQKYRPLPGRTNLVVSRNTDVNYSGTKVFGSIEGAIDFARNAGASDLFVIGGGEVYRQCLTMATCIYLTMVAATPEADTFFDLELIKGWSRELIAQQEVDDAHKYAFEIFRLTRV
jgi:dihydrofolate reductase